MRSGFAPVACRPEALGVLCLAFASEGWLGGLLGWPLRAVVLAASLLLMGGAWWGDVAGIAIHDRDLWLGAFRRQPAAPGGRAGRKNVIKPLTPCRQARISPPPGGGDAPGRN